MSLASGTRIGPYEVVGPLGAGGMGEVYRATDTKLKRQVAIKILPPSLAADAGRLARFQREAEVLASLNHPHIAAIYGLEESQGVTALVMELVEGEDLSQRIARGAIPLDEALPIARQIAEALEAAHEQGIVHRDLKPANIKVRADGTVKVLDFGLAKAMDPPAASSPEAMNSPTITTPAMTQAGMILGTAAYMAPEQARGRVVDKRADIWAFGAVLFEMLTGAKAFAGDDVAEVLSRVLQREPDLATLPPATPARVRALVARCLVKDPRQRLRDIGDVRLALDDAFETAALPATPTPTASSRGRWPWIVATVAVLGSLAMATPTLRYLRQAPPPGPPEMRVEITTPATDAPLEFALSPDGRSLVFVASDDGPRRLWLRPLDQTEARPLAGTEGGTDPFWSPDGRSIGFFAAATLRRIDLAGGASQVLVPLTGTSFGGSWGADGTIVFARGSNNGLFRVPAVGGEPMAITQLDPPRQISHRYPQILPDGRNVLFHAGGTQEASGLYLGSLDGGTPVRLTAADSTGVFRPPDHVIFVRQGTLVARRLDLAGRRLTGDAVTLADRVGVEANGRAGFAASGAGSVAYRAGDGSSRHLTWVDRTGKTVGLAGEPDSNDPSWLELSPDAGRVVMRRTVQGNPDIWLLDVTRGGLTRLTFDPATDSAPIWSPNGMQIAFTSIRTGTFNLYVKPSNGSGAEERLVDARHSQAPQHWSWDGRWLMYNDTAPDTGQDLWALDMTGPRGTPHIIANTAAEELLGQFAPDGRWVAYQTNESGRYEVVVQPFPDGSGKWQVSTAGGVAPRWRAVSQELYFLAPDATLMAVTVTAAGNSFQAAAPVALFPARIADGGAAAIRPPYAVAPDGRFLINQPVGDAAVAPITLILNWNPDAKK